MFKTHLSCICLLLLGILPLAAQSDLGADTKREAGRSAWFACISIPKGLKNPVMVMAGKEITEVKLPLYITSDSVKIPADGVIRIVREAPDPQNTEKQKYLVLATAKIPENVREALIILSPLSKPEGDLVFLAKVQDLAKFKGGDRLYINLSAMPIRVKIGNAGIALPPGRANICESPVLTQPISAPILSEYFHPGDKIWRMYSSSVIVLMPSRREICIFEGGSRPADIKEHAILFPVQLGKP